MTRASTERVSKLHTETLLWTSFCKGCVHGNQDISATCKTCPINGHLAEIGVWLTSDMKSTKPKTLHESVKLKAGAFNFTQAEYDELKAKGLENAEIAHLLGVSLPIFNRYKTKHGIKMKRREVPE